jgi:hypothetical protein
MQPHKTAALKPLFLAVFIVLLAGCGGSSSNSEGASTPAALSAVNLNLIFVVSEDKAFQAFGDVDPNTANLTDQGLQRSLKMAGFLHRRVLGRKNVTGIYALEPMTHLQTANNYPDMAAPETIEQFALLNHITISSAAPPQYIPYTGNSYPINASYAASAVPSGVATPSPCPNCQGLDFTDEGGDNETLVTGIIAADVPGFYVFSAPWETVSALLANINKMEGYNLTLPATYAGPNVIYAISIAPSGSASLVTFNSHLNPPSTYPALPAPVPTTTTCTAQPPFGPIKVTAGIDGAFLPDGINTNETVYIIRHADAHPLAYWTDGNYICAGQWRALDIPNVLRGKIAPQQVYSSDPSQTSPGTQNSWSGVAPSLTAEPYAIANHLPYDLVAGFEISAPGADQLSSNFFFTGDNLSGQTVLVAWSYQFIQPMVNALLGSYFSGGVAPNPAPGWPPTDYDSIWKVTLDSVGNVTVDNSMCEGIDSAKLPATCPQF